MTIGDKIRGEKPQYNINREAAEIAKYDLLIKVEMFNN